MNPIDKAIEAISPKWAAQRLNDRAKLNFVKEVYNSGYSHHGASKRKKSLLGWISSSKSPSEDITDNVETLRERSRDHYIGAPMGRGAVERVVINSVGPGLTLSCRIDADYLGLDHDQAREWEQHVEREFGLWADSKDCDFFRQQNFYELQNLGFRSVLVNGDMLATMPIQPISGNPYDLRVALIEGDRLTDPYPGKPGVVIDGGVELDPQGIPVAYYIANRHPLAEVSGQPRLTFERVAKFGAKTGRLNVLHVMPFERVGQHRGVPFLAPVIETLKQLTRYTNAELMASVIGAMFVLFFERDKDDIPEEGEERDPEGEDEFL